MTKRATAAFFVSPLVGALLYSTAALVNPGYPNGFSEFLVTIAVSYMFAVSAALVFALPAYLVLCRFGLVRWWSALCAGSAVGLICVRLFGSDTSFSRNCWLVVTGAASGVAFWLVRGPSRRLTIVGGGRERP